MRTPVPLPAALADRAFTIREAAELGISRRMLRHPRFTEIHPAVDRRSDLVLDRRGAIEAARLSLPPDAAASHTTRLELAGLSIGPPGLHFTIGRDLHLELEGIALHRTVRMPPTGRSGVSAAAAFIQSATLLKPVELIAAGDWLVRHRRMTEAQVRSLAARDPWRPGTVAALAVLPQLRPDARSVPESEVRVAVVAAGLEVPEINTDIAVGGQFLACGDLVYRRWRLVLEYEGRQHAESPQQFARDIVRYADLRSAGWEYLQITAAMLARPRALVTRIHQLLVSRGYDGPPPVFGAAFRSLYVRPLPPGGAQRTV
ncbi:hypothetical protein HMPREF0063_11811 [Aeromicrobium marinum DSM 15272]|uniref:DUF559 domain-containing protein n=1 Tax=Aeromicrobium marinum DSM 15272 TaxID=585531 RepID=E2SDM5_9ACTN|nr:hypothetical protein [Aeromicrobium marinum]EFQ82602.1 hypothetical protein HMPREF0063_11811 [Aeromicrobium marinum DSM 15272]